MRGFDLPREQQEAAREEYEDTLARCASGTHPPQHVRFEWAYEGDPDVPNGTVTYKVYRCNFCDAEWT